MTEDEKREIDCMSYEQLLRRWRFTPSYPLENKMFQGDTGEYYAQVMKAKGDKLEHSERVNISKKIGWQEFNSKGGKKW